MSSVMTSRNRTALFLRFREEASFLGGREDGQPSKRSGKLLLGTHDGLHQPDGTPAWVRAHEEIKSELAAMRELMGQLAEAHRRSLLISFADEEGSGRADEIAAMSRGMTTKLHRAEKAVKSLWSAPPGSRVMTPQQEEENSVRRNMQKAFAASLQEMSIRFRVDQKDYLRKLEGQKAAVGEPAAGSSEPKTLLLMDDDDPYHQNREDRNSRGGGMAQAQLIEIENAEAQAGQREREIEQVATSVNELALLMKDLATMVVDQGTLLDRIDFNVTSTVDTTEGAVEQLRQADGYSKKRLAFCCTLMLTIGCGVMTVMLLMKLLL